MRRQKSQAEAWCIYVSSCDHGCCDLQTSWQVVKEVSTETIRTCVGRLSEASLEYPSQATWCICASGPSQERQRACCRSHEVPKGSQHGWSLGGMLVAISGLSSCSARSCGCSTSISGRAGRVAPFLALQLCGWKCG